MKKFVFVMIDGLGDVAITPLDGKTPLQYAHTPNMDAIACSGMNGLLDPVQPSLACGSDTAHLSILGYYRGRGAFESMGAGLMMVPGDIAFKSNFATLDPTTNVVTSRRADRHFEHLGPPLCEALTGLQLPSFPNHRIDVQYATEHRCGVRVRGPGLTDNITSTDPLKDNLPLLEALPLDQSKEAIETAKLVNELSKEIHKKLEVHPINLARRNEGKPIANAVLLRGCGSILSAPTFEEKHALKPFIIAPTAIIGMSIVKAPGATGDYRSNFMSKATTLIQTITDHDKGYSFGFLHVKAVDDAGHDRNVKLKKFLEDVDKMIGNILQELSKAANDKFEFSICITGDHSTPVLTGGVGIVISFSDNQRYEPVPFSISKVTTAYQTSKSQHLADHTYNIKEQQQTHCAQQDTKQQRGAQWDMVACFSEIAAAQGVLGRFSGSAVMGVIKDFMHL